MGEPQNRCRRWTFPRLLTSPAIPFLFVLFSSGLVAVSVRAQGSGVITNFPEVVLELDFYSTTGYAIRNFSAGVGQTIVVKVSANATTVTNGIAGNGVRGIDFQLIPPPDSHFSSPLRPDSSGYLNDPVGGVHGTNDLFYPGYPFSANTFYMTNNARSLANSAMFNGTVGTNRIGHIGVFRFHTLDADVRGLKQYRVVGQAYDYSGNPIKTSGSTAQIRLITRRTLDITNSAHLILDASKIPGWMPDTWIQRIFVDSETKIPFAMKSSYDLQNWGRLCEITNTIAGGWIDNLDFRDFRSTNQPKIFYKADSF